MLWCVLFWKKLFQCEGNRFERLSFDTQNAHVYTQQAKTAFGFKLTFLKRYELKDGAISGDNILITDISYLEKIIISYNASLCFSLHASLGVGLFTIMLRFVLACMLVWVLFCLL